MKPEGSSIRRPVPLWIPAALAAGPVVALGFARFAYALLLPAMVRELGWSLTTAGAMNTANALGYLMGALAAAPLAHRRGLARVFIASMAVTSVAVLGSGLTSNGPVLALIRWASGAAGGVAFVLGGGLVAKASAQDSSHRAAFLLGVYFSGAGLGIVLSAWIVPALLAVFPQSVGWRLAWGTLGLISLATLPGVVSAARRVVQDYPTSVSQSSQARLRLRRLRPVLIAYGFYGAGYIVYMTFIVVFLQQHGAGPQKIVWFWTLLGTAAMTSAFLWGNFLGRTAGGRGVALLIGLVLCGVLLPLWSTTTLAVLGSAVLFGAAFLAVVTGVTAVARRSLPVNQWTAALGALTVAFGVGQSLGPFFAGSLSDTGGGLRLGLVLSAAMLGLGVLMALAQPDHRAVVIDESPTLPE